MTYRARGSQLSPSAFVILGMIRLGQRSGYEIKQAVEQSINFFWRISQAQIYPLLQTLEADGLIQGRDDPQGRRPRRLFDLTAAGELALNDWLTADEPLSHELRDGGYLKVFFADALDRASALELLDRLEQRSRVSAAELVAILPRGEAASDRGNEFPLVTLRLGIAQNEAVADACAAVRAELLTRDRPTDRGPQ